MARDEPMKRLGAKRKLKGKRNGQGSRSFSRQEVARTCPHSLGFSAAKNPPQPK